MSEERNCHGLPSDTPIHTSRGQLPYANIDDEVGGQISVSELKEADQPQYPSGEKRTITTYLPRDPIWSIYRTRFGFNQEGV